MTRKKTEEEEEKKRKEKIQVIKVSTASVSFLMEH